MVTIIINFLMLLNYLPKISKKRSDNDINRITVLRLTQNRQNTLKKASFILASHNEFVKIYFKTQLNFPIHYNFIRLICFTTSRMYYNCII